jgi:hypothetical protein
MSKTVQWIMLLAFGGLAGFFIGELMVMVVPGGLVRDILDKTISFGLIPPGTLDLKFLSLTFGFQLKLTLMGLLGLGLAFYMGKYLR